jgi:hypothetical protein
MKKLAVANLILVLILSIAIPVNAEMTTNVRVGNNLVVTYDFKNLNQTVYDQAFAQFKADTIPNTIVKNLAQKNQPLVHWGFGPEPLAFDNGTRSIYNEFFLGGSDIISVAINTTTFGCMYQVKTDWRKFQLNLTSNYVVNFAKNLLTPVAQWSRLNSTTFFYENNQTGSFDMLFYITLPASATGIQVQGDTISYELPPVLEDQLFDSPFLILGALAVALIIILLYRKTK